MEGSPVEKQVSKSSGIANVAVGTNVGVKVGLRVGRGDGLEDGLGSGGEVRLTAVEICSGDAAVIGGTVGRQD